MNLVLPWPPAALSPNARSHHMVLARAKKRYRTACALHAMKQGATAMQVETISLRLVFVPPNRIRRDVDNCLAAMKAGLDGLADVLKVDDSKWQISFELAQEVGGPIGGMLLLHLLLIGQLPHP